MKDSKKIRVKGKAKRYRPLASDRVVMESGEPAELKPSKPSKRLRG